MGFRAFVVMGFVVALATGCSGSSDGGAPPPATTGGQTGSSGSSASATTDATVNGAGDAGVDASNPGPAIASATGRVSMNADPKAKLKVDVLSLKRKDKLLVLTMQVTPTNSLADPQALFTLLGNHFWQPTLIDSVNLKEYGVVNGSSSLQSSVTSVRAASGQPMFLYAVFAAPPAEVGKLNLIFTDAVPTLNDVPIS